MAGIQQMSKNWGTVAAILGLSLLGYRKWHEINFSLAIKKNNVISHQEHADSNV